VGRILTKSLYVEQGYGAKKIIAEFPRKTGQWLQLIACFDVGHFATAAGSVTLII